MASTLSFYTVLRKFIENTKKKTIFSQYNIFKNINITFFNLCSDFSINSKKTQLTQDQCSLCWSLPCFHVLLCTHYGPLQCFTTHFRKSKEIEVLRHIFPDCVISCDYGIM